MTTQLDHVLDGIVGPAAPKPAPPPGRAAAPCAELVDVELRFLVPDPDNPREDVGDVTELANSMASTGLLQPVVARRDTEGRLIVVAGHRRLAAAQQLGWAKIQTIIRRNLRPDHVLVAMYVENSQRVDLDPIEEARALARIQSQAGDCSQADLARMVGRNQVHVSSRLALLALPVEEQELVRARQMSLTEAVHRGRVASGRMKPAGQDKGWHLGPHHDLSRNAAARCRRLGHKRGRTVGGIACGECWESVIRADERQHIHQSSARKGECLICSSPFGPATGSTA